MLRHVSRVLINTVVTGRTKDDMIIYNIILHIFKLDFFLKNTELFINIINVVGNRQHRERAGMLMRIYIRFYLN